MLRTFARTGARRTRLTRSRGLSAQAAKERPPHHNRHTDGGGSGNYVPRFGSATPRQLTDYLDQFVVGQENAKKVLSVAVFNHYNRVRANLGFHRGEQAASHFADSSSSTVQPTSVKPIRKPMDSGPSHFPSFPIPHFQKSNVLVVGPTGSGKTLLVRTLARMLDVPFSISDATTFTQSGYVGEDVDMAIHRLLQDARYDPFRASMGIVYIDEIDKIARRSGSGMEGARDVSGEGVQQALLRMMEGSVVSVQPKGGEVYSSPSGDASGPSVNPAPSKNDTYLIDTSNVLFIFSGAFVGLDRIVRDRVSKVSIGFDGALKSPKSAKLDSEFFTSYHKKPSNILELAETQDLVQFGFIPEFISRLPSITSLAPLTIPDLRRILTEVKGSLMSQYQALFNYSGIEMRFTSAAIDAVCQLASGKGGGARGLTGIMEGVLLNAMYDTPGTKIRYVLITEDTVKGAVPAVYWEKENVAQFYDSLRISEEEYSRRIVRRRP